MLGSKILIFNFWKYLSEKRKRQIIYSIIFSIITGVSELITINSSLPFIGVITGSKNLSNNQITKQISNFLNVPVDEKIIIPIILFFALSVILSTALRVLSIWINNKISALIGSDLNFRSLSNTIYQPYSFHTKNNSSKIVTANTIYIDRTAAGISNSLLFVSNLIISILIIFAIFSINTIFAIYSFLLIFIVYFLIYKKLNKRVQINSQKVASSNKYKVKSLQELMGSIKTVLIESNQEDYLKEIARLDNIARKLTAENSFISEFPRYIIECMALVIITLSTLLIFQFGVVDENTEFIILLGTFTLGFQRLLPVIQRVYNTWINIKSVSAESKSICKILEMQVSKRVITKKFPFDFKKSIKLDSIYFSYNKNTNTISNLNLEIFKGQKIGIVGKTGSGKSTIIDLIIGILKPTSGKIYVDKVDIHDKQNPNKIIEWMRSISYVPQDIFLIDGTIAENITFGIKGKYFKMSKVIKAAKKAQIHDFIESTENGYSTYVGERGIRLSGGQRQRIGIARALYKESKLLILDEATSALDNKTEIELMKCINEISNDLTILSIAHRKTSLKDCDRIIEIQNGLIFSETKPKEIL